ncbi:extracellular tyrosine-protein kinase PKDCC-like [Hyperolius riggenbachi]|uniref:extracellular tyrosine-protein kinase PKDCC-like n=1 Tax=Hyperolius riggenbachi TaxID=752182 RepID=UPI0035A273E0
MRGHLIFSAAALILTAIFLKLSSHGKGTYNDKYMSLLQSQRSPDIHAEILQRHRDFMFFHQTLQAISRPGRWDEPQRILGAQVDVQSKGMLTCEDLAYLSSIDYIGSGFTKLVLKGTLLSGRVIALKSVHSEGNDVKNCVQVYGDAVGCHRLATYKLQKEIALMQILRHPGIIQLQGQCRVNSSPEDIRVTAMLELGSPLQMIQLLQAPWEERFKICLELVRLLHYLANSPLGSVALLDFQPRQFVLVDGSLKLTDMDDATSDEIQCREDSDCTLSFPARAFVVTCSSGGTCVRTNEKRNLYNAYRFFFTYLLPHASPPALRPQLQDIMNGTGDLRLGINETLEAFEDVLSYYKSGMELNQDVHLKEFEVQRGFRINDTLIDDFRCWPSYKHQGCVLSMHSVAEAAEFCNSRHRCRSFVIGQHRTWTGRHLVSFTSSTAQLIPDKVSDVYVKRPTDTGTPPTHELQKD